MKQPTANIYLTNRRQPLPVIAPDYERLTGAIQHNKFVEVTTANESRTTIATASIVSVAEVLTAKETEEIVQVLTYATHDNYQSAAGSLGLGHEDLAIHALANGMREEAVDNIGEASVIAIEKKLVEHARLREAAGADIVAD